MAIAGSLSDFYARLDGTPGGTSSYTFTVRKNGVEHDSQLHHFRGSSLLFEYQRCALRELQRWGSDFGKISSKRRQSHSPRDALDREVRSELI